jgi:outer membrane scaffolding protein for murein synthesis (MipA/OmpV family)
LLRKILAPCLLAAVMACGARLASAQTPSPMQEWQYPGGIELERLFAHEIPEWDRILGLAASVQPIYSGSSRYRASEGPVINIRYRDRVFLATGEGLGVDFLQGKQYRVTLSVGVDLGRREEWDIGQLRGMGDIPRAPFFKLSSSYVISRRLPIILRGDIRKIAGGSAGLVGDLEVYTPLPGSSRRLVMFAGPSVTIADRKHLQTGYGISEVQSLNSGYPVYSAHGGLEAAGLGFSATRFLTPHFLVNTDFSWKELMGSAGSSPLVRRRAQASFDLSAAYRW